MIWSLKIFSFMIMCFTIWQVAMANDKLQVLRESINKNNIKSKILTENSSSVTINNREYITYVYVTDDSNTLNNVITCISCEIGTWTVNELFTFLEPFPSKNHASFIDIENNVFGEDYTESVKILNIITDYTERFINILLNFTNKAPYDSAFDTNLLKLLISLNLKIEYIKTLGNSDENLNNNFDTDTEYYKSLKSDKNYFSDKNRENDCDIDEDDDEDNTQGYDDVILRIIFETINSIRGFMALNCEFSLPLYSYHKLNNYPMDQTITNKYGIDNFLNDIEILHLEPNMACSAKRMLLLESGNWWWTGIIWKTKNGNIIVEKIMKYIGTCNDLEITLWYQKLVFKTIMKIILIKVQTYDKQLLENVVERFKTFYIELIFDFNNLPIDIIEIFFTLYNYDSNNYNDLLTKINKYTDSATEIHFDTRVQSPFLMLSLEGILDLVINDVNNFKCFVRLFEFLKREDGRESHLPFKKDAAKVESFVSNIHFITITTQTVSYFQLALSQHERITKKTKNKTKQQFLNNSGCKYIQGLYYYCAGSFNALNNAFTQGNSQLDYNEAYSYLSKIHTHLISIVSSDYWYRPHFKLVYYIVPLLELHVIRNNSDFSILRYHNLMRLVYTIVIELNSYWLQYCHPPEYNFWFLQNINFGQLGLFRWVDTDVLTITKDMINNGKQNKIYSYKSIINFSEWNDVFNLYNDKILFNWKSEKKSIAHIYKNHLSVVLSVSIIYGFYSFFKRFFLALIFYELNYIYATCYESADENNVLKIGDNLRVTIDKMVNSNSILENYMHLIIKINSFKIAVEDKLNKTYNDVMEKKMQDEMQQIEDQFKLIGVYFKSFRNNNEGKPLPYVDNYIESMYNLIVQMHTEGTEYDEI